MMWRSRKDARTELLLVALAKRLRAVAGSLEPRAEFRSSLRTFLMMEAPTAMGSAPDQPGVPSAQVTRLRPRGPVVVAAAFVAAALGMGGMASASASALPGEALYPVKRAVEQVELTFHRDPADRGAFQLELAERRLDEARELSAQGPESADLAAESVREFETTAAEATTTLVAAFHDGEAHTASLAALNSFTARTDAVLSSLAPQLSAGGTAAVTDARDRLATIDSQSNQLCPTCSGGLDEGPSSPDRSDGSSGPPPEPAPEPDSPAEPDSEPEPESPPGAPPAAPPASVPSDRSSVTPVEPDDEDEEDESEEEDEETDDEAEQPDELAPPPAPPAPIPTPEPQPTPTPDPTPTPTEPLPTEPPAVLDIVPGTIAGVGEALGDVLGGLL